MENTNKLKPLLLRYVYSPLITQVVKVRIPLTLPYSKCGTRILTSFRLASPIPVSAVFIGHLANENLLKKQCIELNRKVIENGKLGKSSLMVKD